MAQPIDDCDDTPFTIVNRTQTYTVSKKLVCSKIPYFDKMFSSGCKESQENRVELDFDEQIFQQVMFYLNDCLLIQLKDLVPLHDIADYLLIEDLREKCSQFYLKMLNEFNIDHVCVIMDQLSESSNLIGLKTMDFFVERHFLKIIHSKTFVDYTFKTIDHILKLDLWIDSEYQVFEALANWIEHDIISRKQYLSHLLKHIRWPFVDAQDLMKIKAHVLITKSGRLNEFPEPKQHVESRITKNVLIALLSDQDVSEKCFLRVFYLADDEKWHPINKFTEDDNLPNHLMGDSNCIDVFYEYGRKLVRLNLETKTFRRLDPIIYLNKLISKERDPLYDVFTKDGSTSTWSVKSARDGISVDSFVESNGRIIFSNSEFIRTSNSQTPIINKFHWPRRYYSACKSISLSCVPMILFENKLYFHSDGILTSLEKNNPEQLSILFPKFIKDISDTSKFSLTSNETKLLLADKSTKRFHFYNPKQRNWFQDDFFNETMSIEGVASLKMNKHYLDVININNLPIHK